MKKPKIRYTLEAKSKDVKLRTTPESVIAEISAGFKVTTSQGKKYKPVKLSTQCTVMPREFGKIENNYKFDESVFGKTKYNQGLKTQMNLIQSAVDTLHSHYLIGGVTPSRDEFVKAIRVQLGIADRETNVVSIGIMEYLNKQIAEHERRLDTNRRDKIKQNTLKVKNTLRRYINDYETATGLRLYFDTFTESVWFHFWDTQNEIMKGNIILPIVKGIRARRKSEMGFMVNSIVKYQKEMKALCEVAKKDKNQKIKVALDTTDENLLLQKTDVSKKNFVITEGDLLAVYNYNGTLPKALEEAREYTILASLCGMRNQSVAIAEGEQMIESDGRFFLHTIQEKTGTECLTPLFNPAVEVLRKHDGKFPRFSVNQVTNENIKELFKVVGIDRVQNLSYFPVTGKVIKRKVPTYEAVTTHDFRDSFYTVLSDMGMQSTTIELVTHPDKKSTAMSAYYDKRSALQRAKNFIDEFDALAKKSDFYKF